MRGPLTPAEIDLKSNWVKLAEALKNLDEETLKLLLQHEIHNNKRPDIALRIHTRWSTLRKNREKKELLQRMFG